MPSAPARITMTELRRKLGTVLRRAKVGERFVITSRGHPVAEIGPPNSD